MKIDRRFAKVRLSHAAPFAAFAVAGILLLSQTAFATTDTWSGLAGDGLWSTPGNWNALPGAADTALFNNSTSTTVSLNAAAQSVKNITFDTSVGSFTFNTGGAGGQFNLAASGAITLTGSATGTNLTELFNTPLSLGGNYTITDNRGDAGSSFDFAGNITNTATSLLTISGSGTGTGNIISGNITDGTGVQSLTFSASAGKWTLSGNNNYSGLTSLTGAGTLVLLGVNSSASGQTTAGAGILELDDSSDGGLAGGAVSLNGGTVQSLVSNLSLSNNFVLQNLSTVSGANNITINGNFTNSGGNRTLASSITSGTLNLAGNVYLSEAAGTGRIWTINGSGKTVISGVMADFNGSGTAGTFIADTTGSVTLSNANTYSGGTVVAEGTVIAGQSTVSGATITSGAFGAGAILLSDSSGTIAVEDNGTAITLANSVNVNSSATFATTGGGSLTFDGTGLTTPATFAMLGSYTLSVTNTTTIKDNISGGFTLTKGGVGTLILAGNNTVSSITLGGGGVTVISGNNTGIAGGITFSSNGGTLDLTSPTALGPGTFSIGNSDTLDNTSGSDLTLTTNNPISLAGSFTFTGSKSLNTGTGNITLTSNPGITVTANTLTFGGGISGAHSFVKGGAGTLVLAGTDSYTGATSVSAGALSLQNNSCLGTGAGASSSGVSVTSGAALQLQGGISTTTAVPVTSLNGAGLTAAPNGAIENVSGNNTYSGPITLASASSIGSDAGTLTLTGSLNNGGNLPTFIGAGNITISTTGIGGAGGITMNGSGILTLAVSNTYTGTTTINTGTVSVGVNSPVSAAGAFGNAGANIVFGSATLTGPAAILTNAGGITIGRGIAENTGATNSSLSIGGSQTSGTSTYTGAIGLKANTILTSAAGGEVDFTTSAISGAFNVTIDGGGTVKLAAGNTFGGAGNSITIQNGTTLLASGTTNLGNTANSLIFNNGILAFGGVFDPSARTITINSGGAAFNTNGSSITFANAIGNSGSGGLTKAGAGTLTLDAASTYTGATTVASGTLALGTSGGISGTLDLGNSNTSVDTLDVSAQSSYSQANISGNGAINIGTGKTVTATGAVTPGFSLASGTLNVTGNFTLAGTAATTLAVGGSGAGQFDLINATGTFTYGGTLTITSLGGYDLTQAATYGLINAGTYSNAFDFSAVTVGGVSLTDSGGVWTGLNGNIEYTFTDATGQLAVTAAVPEPQTWAMMLGGLGLLVSLQRIRRRGIR